MTQSFIERVLAGTADTADIDAFVERWHTSAESVGLRQALGLTAEEYELWVFQPAAFELIVGARRTGKSLSAMVSEGGRRPGPTPEQRTAIIDWLRRTGRVA